VKWPWIVGGVVVGIPVALALVGSLVPRNHVARVRIALKSSPERVWGLITDFAGTPRWRKDVSKIELTSSSSPVRFVEHSKQGKVPFEVVSQEAPRRQVVRVVDDDQPFGGTWTWELAPDGSGTRLMITEAGFVKNPIFRAVGLVFFSPSATMEAYLRGLARELGETAEPERLGNNP
jgi:uncharacterized protein YndB with AHSA1/START domain